MLKGEKQFELELELTGKVELFAARALLAAQVVPGGATNHHADTVIRRFWFDRANLAVLPGTTRFQVRAVGSTAHPTVSVVSRTRGQTLLRIGFGTKLYSGRSLGLRLTFDLPDPGGSADRDVRIGDAIATFPVWAFGSTDTPGGSAAVVMPAGYRVEVLRGPLSGPTPGANGAQVYSSGRLARPLDFFAYVLADRPGAYATTRVDLTVAGQRLPVVVRHGATMRRSGSGRRRSFVPACRSSGSGSGCRCRST